jgi:hypothetical protein
MAPFIVPLTAVESAFGFILTSTVLYLVVSRGRRTYHYIFAAFLLVCAIWDLGTFLIMLRNGHPQELDVIGRIIFMPCIFIPALVLHFAIIYTGRRMQWLIALVWIISAAFVIAGLAGVIYQIEGFYSYEWGNIFRVKPSVLDPLIFIIWFAAFFSACWLLIRNRKSVSSAIEKRHHLYIIVGLLAVAFAIVKALVTIGIDAPLLLPLGMFLNDIFVAVIGVAIIKDRLFDITIVIKKGTLYSILAGFLIFIYSLSEHILVTYIGHLVGEDSTLTHLISISVAIVILMPVKSRLERWIDGYFHTRKLAF